MRYTSFLTLLAVSSPCLAQTSTVRSIDRVGVFVQAGAGAPQFTRSPAPASATETDPIAVAADVQQPRVHARTKASLRLSDGLPVLRVYEAGFAHASPARQLRTAGTTDSSSAVGTAVRPHSWLLQHNDTPGRRVRVHVRLRSTTDGSAAVSGLCQVDVGDDNSVEFAGQLDGARHLDNLSVTIGASGRLDVRVDTGALLRTTSLDASSYAMTLDVSLEPVQGQVTSFVQYGPLCGPEVSGVSWVNGTRRHVRLLLDNARPNATAAILFGIDRQEVQLPGALCSLLTTPGVIVPAATDLAGRSIDDLPAFDTATAVDVRVQYAVLGGGAVEFSQGLRFRTGLASDRSYEHFDVNHVVSTGQSLALGGLGAPVLSTAQPFKNMMFDNGVLGSSLKFAPLVESYWETMSSGLASTVSDLHYRRFNDPRAPLPGQSHDLLVSVSAAPGMPYTALKRGTPVFEHALSQQRLGQRAADLQNRSYTVRCVTVVHGEDDHQIQNGSYARDMLEWQRDYEAEFQRRGMTRPIPMLFTQMSSFSSYGSSWSFIPVQQLEAHEQAPRKLVLVGPKYALDYLPDGVHLTSQSYRHMGEYYGKVYAQMFLEGVAWEPLRPLHLTRNGAVIRVRFHVPEPPLVFDTQAVRNPGNFGFEYTDSSPSPPQIRSVSLVDEDTVEIVLSAAPVAAATKWVGYAYTATPKAKSGPQFGARGNLRDSDPTPSFFHSPLHNWAVHFFAEVK